MKQISLYELGILLHYISVDSGHVRREVTIFKYVKELREIYLYESVTQICRKLNSAR